MKNTLFLFFLLVFSPLFSIAQDYEPMLQEGSFWDVSSWEHFTACKFGPRRFYLDEEIVFEGETYYKLRKHQIVDAEGEYINCMHYAQNYFVSPDFTYSDVYIREDLTEKKVYVWAVDPEYGGSYQEFLLYDFSVEVGDVLPSNLYSYDYGTHVWTVTQIEIDSENHKTIYLNNMEYMYTEGEGGYSGVISPIYIIHEAPDELYCHGNAENQNECSGFLGTDDFTEKNFNIYPNPVQETLFVVSENSSSLELFNILGKQVYSTKGKKNHSIDMSNYTKGFYLLKVTDATDGYVKTFKIVVE